MNATSPAPKRSKLAVLLVLFVLPLALRLAPIRHGLPRNYVPDTHVVRAALGMANDRTLVPPVGKYSTYPNAIPYMLLPIFVGRYALGRLDGSWSGAGEFGNHLKEHPETAHLPARIWIAILGALTPWLVFRTARAGGARAGAWIAAWLCATSVLHVHLSVQERAWVPMTFFLAAAAWPAVVHVRDGGTKPLLASGALAALSFSCHQAGLLALGIPGLAWAFGPPGWTGAALRSRLSSGFAAVALFAVVSLLIGYPALLVHGITPDDAISGGDLIAAQDAQALSLGGQTQPLGIRFASLETMLPAFLGHDLVLGALAPFALVFTFLKQRRLRFLCLFALLWTAVFTTNKNDFVRYLLPLTALFAIPVGSLLEALWERRATRVAVIAALAFTLVMSTRLVSVLAQPDTRAEAERLLVELPTGSRVAIDRYGPLPPLDLASLELLKTIRETPLVRPDGEDRVEGLRAREEHRYFMYTEGGEAQLEPGLSVVRVEELLDFEKQQERIRVRPFRDAPFGTTPREALRSVGVTHVLAVTRFPTGDYSNPLPLEDVLTDARTVWSLDPRAGEAAVREACLPSDMYFPLTALWSVSRPGPKLTLYEL